MKLPLRFKEKMKNLLGTEYQEYIACYDEPRIYGLRINTAKISVTDFVEICPFEIQPIPWIENGFYYDGEKVTPAKHPYYFAGLYYLQEPSAMTPANRLPIEDGDKVLDLCAAPGGKATELGARLNDSGVLVANDISNSRARALLKNIELFGIGNVLVLSEEPSKLSSYFKEYFDKILVDAPCSGEGMFRKDKKLISEWEERGPQYFARLQEDILDEAVKMLKPGGYLLYSTCTFDVSENEERIKVLQKNHPELEICEIAPYEHFTKGKGLPETVRIYPWRMRGEGHYLALIRKNENNTAQPLEKFTYKTKVLPEELKEFLKYVLMEFDNKRIEIIDDKVYYMPKDIPRVQGLRFLRSGLLLGTLKTKRFEPSQTLAMYLEFSQYKRTLNFSLADERVVRYLKGETLVLDDMTAKGWYLIGVDGFPLGWGKCTNGMLKNKYAQGWRWV